MDKSQVLKKDKIEIINLFFKDFNELFNDTLIEGLKDIDLENEQVLEKLPDALVKVFSEYEEFLTTLYLDKHKFKLDDFLIKSHSIQKRIIKHNKEPFIYFLLYINICVIIYEKILEAIDECEQDLNSTIKVNISLYGLSIRRAQQIVDLLISGYIDGAMIIWRSLYENAVCLLILAINNNDELTERFIEHAFRNSNRKARGYEANYEDLKFKPLPKETFDYLEKEKNRLIKKYGKEFISNDYGWANILFKGKANFRLLEEMIKLQRFRPYYTLCSEQIHSNFNGFRSFMEDNRIILPRIMNPDIELDSFVDPMQFTIGILHEINDYIIWEFSTQEEFNANILFLKKVFEKLITTFERKNR